MRSGVIYIIPLDTLVANPPLAPDRRDVLRLIERHYNETDQMADALMGLFRSRAESVEQRDGAARVHSEADPSNGLNPDPSPKGQEAEGPDIERDDDALVIRWWGPGHASCYSPTYLGDGKVVTALSTKGGSRTAINPTGERVFADLEALATSPTRDEAPEGDGQDQGGKG